MRIFLKLSALLLAGACSTLAQPQAADATSPASSLPKPLTLSAAIQYAQAHYPAVRAALERVNAARAGVGLAKTSYLPSANALWQGNRATRNNIFGLLLPQSVVPSLTGPVLPAADNASVWGSAGGVLASWEPFDFGYRRAAVNSARATQSMAEAEKQLTELDVAAMTAAAFLDLAAAQQAVQAGKADLERRQTFFRTVHTLVENQLRPGVEESRASAELAAARIRLIQAETSEQVGRAALAELLGVAPAVIAIDAGNVLQLPGATAESFGSAASSSPVARAEQFRAEFTQAQLREVERSYVPRVNLQSSLSGRGSGANVDGTIRGGAAGLSLDRYNWAAGVTITFPAFDFFAMRSRKQIAEANVRAQQAHYAQTVLGLNAQVEKVRAIASGARSIAENTPVELQAATDAERQARARYQAGLTNILEVSEAQALLAQAQMDDALARLNAWRALSGLAIAQGNLQPFLDALGAAGGH